eukprot:CAMPEP_0184864896 /NCGR_PEP_ID=MMETSP0580-20130426/16259_1 /TAXON_ID=1118495 /ORGANISM="Dactyliosolen fragilissimus" /LENGTH=451 /DNA_ID=CAMNT_0027363843 /DNA_START=60 /DNA_END=1415 /DNA_ORIENTATION=-
MVQMSAADKAVVMAIDGNDKCADCGQKFPQWASVSFGTVFCLECSGAHRGLGVHISFVRSIAMDSWTQEQLKLMKAGGNDKCKQYLSAKGIASNTAIKPKYESDAAQLYKEVLKARAEGRPEPTQLTKKTPTRKSNSFQSNLGGSNHSSSSSFKSSNGSDDPNGMERLTGESDEQYIARQTRLRNEAKARMAAKFGGSKSMGGVGSSYGNGGGGSSMQGFGSNSSYNPNTGSYGAGGGLGFDVENITGSITSGFGSAWSTVGDITSRAGSALQNDANIQDLTSSVKSTGFGLWSSMSSAVQDVARSLAESESDGLHDLQRQMKEKKSASNNTYEGFGSDTMNVGVNSINTSNTLTTSNTAIASTLPKKNEDPNGLERLTGESEVEYMQRQTRIRDEAKERMNAKFGTNRTMSTASSIPRPSPKKSPPPKPSQVQIKEKMQTSDDFFNSFGT